jgi:hypothetical protein
MVARVSRGNIIELPLLTKEELATRLITVKWSQNHHEREEKYYALVAKNDNGESGLSPSDCPMLIQTFLNRRRCASVRAEEPV